MGGTVTSRGCLELLPTRVNCCDVAPGLICVGASDAKMRVYHSSGSGAYTENSYRRAEVVHCKHEEVRGLRITVERAAIVCTERSRGSSHQVLTSFHLIDQT